MVNAKNLIEFYEENYIMQGSDSYAATIAYAKLEHAIHDFINAVIALMYKEKGIEEFHMHLTYFINFAEILALALIVIALIKDGTLSKENYASLAIIAVLFGVMAFLSTQLDATSFSQARAIFSGVIYIYCAVIVAILGGKKLNVNNS
jgi:hypothetical protein